MNMTPESKIKEIAEGWNIGLSANEIVKLTGCSHSAVYHHKPKNKIKTSEIDDEIVRLQNKIKELEKQKEQIAFRVEGTQLIVDGFTPRFKANGGFAKLNDFFILHFKHETKCTANGTT